MKAYILKKSKREQRMIKVKTHAIIVACLCFAAGCMVNYEVEFRKSMDNENYVGAKRLIHNQLSKNAFDFPIEEQQVKAIYRLAFVHGKLSEYDSMKAMLDTCVVRNNNSQKARREMLEYFSLDEFNKAVFLYNNYFFDKAITKLKIAIAIVGTESPYEEYSAVIFRCLAYAESSNSNIEKALEYCRSAAKLGDALSKKILADWEKEKKITPPEKLEPREKPILTI